MHMLAGALLVNLSNRLSIPPRRLPGLPMTRLAIALAITLSVGSSIICPTATAEVTFEMIGIGAVTALSADGTVAAGNTEGEYETFRWTEAEGIVPLGRATVPVIGTGAGAPDISADGTRISATILGADSTYATQGRWTLGSGWQETMPPTPPDGGLMDNAYGSAWGISDDGEMVVGLYWRPGQPDGSAHASSWTESTGVLDLGSSGRDSRANDANQDGSVIVGWDCNPSFGNWWPTVWVNGELTTLNDNDGFAEACTVNPDGTIVAGYAFNDSTQIGQATAWYWNGNGWDEQDLGYLPGTAPGWGTVLVNDMTPDGSIMVGYNRFSNPFYATGFIWTASTGLVDVEDFLTDNGVILDPSFDLRTLTGISDDGSVMVGVGQDVNYPYYNRSFIIRIGGATSIASGAEAPAVTSRVRLWPNPTRGAATASIDLNGSEQVELAVYDTAGRLVRRLLDGSLASGRQELRWDGRDATGGDVPAGIYFYQLRAGTHRETHKLTIVR